MGYRGTSIWPRHTVAPRLEFGAVEYAATEVLQILYGGPLDNMVIQSLYLIYILY